ncbi:FtsK/SpoIIIE domain-containing protein [Bacillus benzoevorans]|uniref:S-DNA-T family DNA segregation ATPase FtsK/SpoIIIE n=1 Tax=Bacillus benzoevorans TaxID=1456 RepID=A0A7X0LW80_9BACI|nr:FtsK/SpoIIIE domain-containing protein [Bacillus benzoevorans]MBB6446428.1 S-DNA-T family DNA segregation ATPase FtsK/SpoIIIE [Bacillus benzoevorans]
MIFEIGSTIIMGALGGYAYLKTNGPAANDADKIQRIFTNSGLIVRENGKTETIHLQRKRKFEGGTEYIYQLPLGLSSKEVIDKRHVLEDGLNVRSKIIDINLSDLRAIKFDKTIVQQIQNLFNGKRIKKEIEIEFDGMMKIKVYNSPLIKDFPWNESFITKDWKVPVGRSRDKLIFHDFDSNYFMIVAGAAGFGKSQFLKMVITTLILQQPENIHFHLIDLKGGLSFSRFKKLKQVSNFGKDRKDAITILEEVQNIMNHRHEYLEENGFEDVKEANMKDRHFIVIDEAADLTDECQNIVEDIARRGRACGLRMLYATQYPTNETLRSQVRQNALARVCFKLKTNIASRAVLDEGGAEELPEIPGRAIYQTVSNTIVQTPYMSNKKINEWTMRFVREDKDEKSSSQTTKNRKHTLVLEETELFD